MQTKGSALQFVDPTLKADWHVVLAAVTTDGLALAYADDTLRDEPEIVLLAVAQNGFALEFASAARRADKEVVLAAVREEGQALIFASDDLKNDTDVVETAVGENYRALKFAASNLASDVKVVEAARASMESQRADGADVAAVETMITKMRRLSLQGECIHSCLMCRYISHFVRILLTIGLAPLTKCFLTTVDASHLTPRALRAPPQPGAGVSEQHAPPREHAIVDHGAARGGGGGGVTQCIADSLAGRLAPRQRRRGGKRGSRRHRVGRPKQWGAYPVRWRNTHRRWNADAPQNPARKHQHKRQQPAGRIEEVRCGPIRTTVTCTFRFLRIRLTL